MKTPDELKRLLYETVSEQFGVPVERLSEATTAHDVDGWDSMAHGVLIMTLEGKLGFELPLERVMEAQSLGQLLDIVVSCG